MSKQQYECTVLLDASNGQTVFANSPEEAAELAQDAAMEDGAGSLCHYCSKHTDTGDIYGVVVYEDDNEVLNTTYHAEREKSLQGKIDALQLRLNAVEEENDRLREGWYKDESDNNRFWPEELHDANDEIYGFNVLLQDLLDYDISIRARQRIEEALSISKGDKTTEALEKRP